MASIRKLAALPLAAAALIASPAWAHGDEIHDHEPLSQMWHFSPEIVFLLALAVAVYANGLRKGPRPPITRIVGYFAGLLAFFLALISPIEPLADHIFAVHQVEHMLLRTIGPMLIFLSEPQAVLMRGLPLPVRRGFTSRLAGTGWLQQLFHALTRPAVATGLFLLSSYFWMMPHWHDLAILSAPIHYTWHITLLVSGLLFFGVILDRRKPPVGPGIGARLGMFVAAALGNILLGSFLTLKPTAIYSAYVTMGHFWHVPMALDEQTGGAIMWMPGTMMLAITGVVVLFRFARDEDKASDRRLRDNRPAPARAANANARIAVGLALFAGLMLMLAFAAAITVHTMDAHRAPGAPHVIP